MGLCIYEARVAQLYMGPGLGCGGRAGYTWGQGQYVRPFEHAWTLEPFIF